MKHNKEVEMYVLYPGGVLYCPKCRRNSPGGVHLKHIRIDSPTRCDVCGKEIVAP